MGCQPYQLTVSHHRTAIIEGQRRWKIQLPQTHLPLSRKIVQDCFQASTVADTDDKRDSWRRGNGNDAGSARDRRRETEVRADDVTADQIRQPL